MSWIAERTLRMGRDGSTLTVRIGAPRPSDGDDWECEYAIGRRGDVEESSLVYGVDPMQALLLALTSVCRTVGSITEELSWLGGHTDAGFPTIVWERLTQAEAERQLLQGDPEMIAVTLLQIAMDWPGVWIEGQCLSLTGHSDARVRKAAVAAIGIVARTVGLTDAGRAAAVLRAMTDDPEVAEEAQDILNEILV
jgi:hypothetical protein